MRSMTRSSVGVALVFAGVVGGCELVTGLTGNATLLQPDAGTGGATGTGTGGHAGPGFAFAIKDPSVSVPYGALGSVDVEVTPSGGFSGDVDITVQAAPDGLVTMPLTIAAGSTTGKLQIGAGTTLAVGTTFTLTLAATSGAIVKTAMVPAVVTGKPGDFDETFGSAGLVTGPSSTGEVDFNDIREVAQGKILVGGVNINSLGAALSIGLRFLPNGMPDVGFNGTGAVSNKVCACTTSVGATASVAREIDGSLLFIGWGDAAKGKADDIFLFRYRDAGVTDSIPGDNGTEDIDLGGDEDVTAAALVPGTTNVIVAGGKDHQLYVARIPALLAGGVPDTSFAAPNGFLVPSLGGTRSTASALTLDETGRIVVAGAVTTAGDDDVTLLRLTADGVLDPSFGSGGVVTLARPGNQHGSAVLVQPDGKILVAADTDEGGSPQLLVQRFLPSGEPDPAFGAAGVALAALGGMSNANAGGGTSWMVRMLDGRIVVAGNGTLGTISGPVFARFLPDGSPDPTFGSGGELAVYVGMYGAMRAMTLANDGKLLVAGSTGSNPGGSFIARLWN